MTDYLPPWRTPSGADEDFVCIENPAR